MLKQAGMVKTVFDNTDLVLEAGSNESILVRAIYVKNPALDYLTVVIDRATVGYFRVGGELGNHLSFPKGGSADVGGPIPSLLEFMAQREVFAGYPIATGQTLTLSGAAQATCVQVVVYDLHDANDIKPDALNGTNARSYQFINYGNTGASITAPATDEYDTQQNPSEFPAFPFGKVVPAGHTFLLHGILASSFAPIANDGTQWIGTQYLKLTLDRKVLFDESRDGFPLNDETISVSADQIGVGDSVIHNLSDTDQGLPLWFAEPLVFKEGEELLLHLTTQGGGTYQTITAAEHEVGLVFTVQSPQR